MSTHSSKRAQLTLTLAGLLALLLGAIGWMEFGQSGSAKKANVDVKSVIIKRTGYADIALAKTGSTWNMIAPYKLVANTQRIDPLLTLGAANFDGYDKNEVDLPATGLDSPGASITIGAREFLLGEPDATGERRYTLVDGKISFVPVWVWSLVHGGVTAFSDLTVFSTLPKDVYLAKGHNIAKLANIQQWQSLQADKISAWPDELASTTNAAATTMWQLLPTDNPDSTEPLAQLLRLEDRTLIRSQPGFAYAISNARFDALLSQ